MRISLRSPRFIHFGMSGVIETGDDSEEEDPDSLQEKLRSQVERKEKRNNAREQINKDLCKFNCAICFTKSETLKNNPLCILPCGHTYHASCIVQMLVTTKERHRCPLCRHEIKTTPEIEFIS